MPSGRKFSSTTRPTFTGSVNDRVTLPTIWVAFALSLMLHAAALLGWLPNIMTLPFEDSRTGKPSGSLAVRLAPPPSRLASDAPAPLPTSTLRAHSAPTHTFPSSRAPQPLQSAARVLAMESQTSSRTTPPPAEAVRPPAAADLASYIEARRRAREPVPAAPLPLIETEQERHNRIVAENLGLNRIPSFGTNRNRGGGIFQVQRMGYDSAEFFFYGWNKSISRKSQQMIEVRRGENATMEIAVVRKMIAIIREHVNGDFFWDSPRHGSAIPLSARLADNAELEEFLMREFFPDPRQRR